MGPKFARKLTSASYLIADTLTGSPLTYGGTVMTIGRYNDVARAVVLTLSALLLALVLAVAVGALVGLVDAIAELRDQAEQCELWEVGPEDGTPALSH